jgi:hypothetical protein
VVTKVLLAGCSSLSFPPSAAPHTHPSEVSIRHRGEEEGHEEACEAGGQASQRRITRGVRRTSSSGGVGRSCGDETSAGLQYAQLASGSGRVEATVADGSAHDFQGAGRGRCKTRSRRRERGGTCDTKYDSRSAALNMT